MLRKMRDELVRVAYLYYHDQSCALNPKPTSLNGKFLAVTAKDLEQEKDRLMSTKVDSNAAQLVDGDSEGESLGSFREDLDIFDHEGPSDSPPGFHPVPKLHKDHGMNLSNPHDKLYVISYAATPNLRFWIMRIPRSMRILNRNMWRSCRSLRRLMLLGISSSCVRSPADPCPPPLLSTPPMLEASLMAGTRIGL